MIQRLIDFLNASPVNFLVVKNVAKVLDNAGYERIDMGDAMPEMKAGKRFYTIKNDSSLFAFEIGTKPMAEAGMHIIAAHSDSPTFRIKPSAEIACQGGIVKLNTEAYGGSILNTWLDRPLSIAGRVIVKGQDIMHPESRLLHVKRPLLSIPNLSVHLNKQINEGIKLSKQKDMLPILGIISDELEKENMLLAVVSKEAGVAIEDILDFDLYLYDTTPACLWGMHEEFISSGRLDDLSMVHAGLEALIDSGESETTKVLAVFDNEEVGSKTKQGAGSMFLASIMQRIVLAQGGTLDDYYRMIEKSFLVSADNAHAWHPNYNEKYDPTNHPKMGGGPVIKYNAAQKYVSDAYSAAVFAGICKEAGVPYQTFVNNSEVAGGSTLGNILSASLPLCGVDMGAPMWAMHSIRETENVQDHEYCIKAFTHFYARS